MVRSGKQSAERVENACAHHIIRELNQQGVTILLVEQNAQLALQTAHRGYVLQTAHRGYVLQAGEVAFSGEAAALLVDERVRQAYLG